MLNWRCALIWILFAPPFAAAEDGPFVSGGGTLAASLHQERGNGLVLGGEISGGWLWLGEKPSFLAAQPKWVGGYVDIVRDFFGDNTTRVSLGPELGTHFVALDGGLLIQLGDQRRTGIAVRPAFTV